MPRSKITIIGAGHVGATTALWLVMKELGDIVLVDIVEGMAQGKALDLLQAGPLEGFDGKVVGTHDYQETAGSDVVIIAAGAARKPGMNRTHLLHTNARIVISVIKQAVVYSPQACFIIVTNPVDPLTYTAWKASGLPPRQVMGMAGILDSARLRTFIAHDLGVSVEDISTCILGGHGDYMVPLTRFTYAGGIPVDQIMSPHRLQALIERTRMGGGEIVELLQSGSAYYAPSVAIGQMVEAIVRDKNRILPIVTYLNGEYMERDLYIGVPAVLGEGGVKKVIEVILTDEEKAAFTRAAAAIRDLNQIAY